MKKKLIAALLSAAMVVSAVPVFASDAAADEETTESSTESPVAGKKIAYIMYMSSATIFQMWSDSFTATAEKLGMEASTFFCNDNADTWKSTIEQCAQGGYDGLMVSHGGQEYAYDFLSGILEQYPDLKIVTFDTPFKDANGETAKIDGVTQFFQQDAGFAESLVQTILDMYPEKTEAGEPVNILQVQQGAGYNSPFDRRQTGYEPFETDGKIKTVEKSHRSMIRMLHHPCVTLQQLHYRNTVQTRSMVSGAATMHMHRVYIRHCVKQTPISQWYL